MSEALVKIDNILAWQGQTPFCETYLMHVVDPADRWALFWRFEVRALRDQSPQAGVWCVFAPVDGEAEVFSSFVDLDHDEVVARDTFVKINDCRIGLAGTTGVIENGEHGIRWDLTFEDPVVSARPLSGAWFSRLIERGGLPTWPRLSASVLGDVYVGHRKLSLAGAALYQDHFWGTSVPSGAKIAGGAGLSGHDATFALTRGLGAVPFGSKPAAHSVASVSGNIARESVWRRYFGTKNCDDLSASLKNGRWIFDIEVTQQADKLVSLAFPSGDASPWQVDPLAPVSFSVSKRSRQGLVDDENLPSARGFCAKIV